MVRWRRDRVTRCGAEANAAASRSSHQTLIVYWGERTRLLVAVFAAALGCAADACDSSDSVYWVPESDCTWVHAIGPSTSAAAHAVSLTEDTPRYYRYEVAVVGVQRRFAIHLWKNQPWATEATARRLAKVYAQLPPFLHRMLPADVAMTTHSTGGFDALYCYREIHTGCVTGYVNTAVDDARHLLFMPSDYFLETGAPEPIPAFEEQLLHEWAHLLDHYFGWLRASEWAKAVERDGGAFVTEYAKTNEVEDFAESFVAWVVYRAYPSRITVAARAHIRESARYRLAYFDLRHRRATLRHHLEATPGTRETAEQGAVTPARVPIDPAGVQSKGSP